DAVPCPRRCRGLLGVVGSVAGSKKFGPFPGRGGGVLGFSQEGDSPATRNWTNSDRAEEAGALYRATSGFSVGVMTASDPVTRDATASTAMAVVVSVAWYPSLTATSMS